MRVHLTIPFAEADAGAAADLRHRWDPTMATGVPPHITLVYPEEHHDDVDLLVERAAAAAASTGPFSLRLGRCVTGGDSGEGGVFVEVHDPTGGWVGLRGAIVTDPFTAIDVEPHLTIVHPRTSDRGPEAWTALGGTAIDLPLAVHELALSTTSAESGMVIERRFPLQGWGPRLCAGVVLVEDGRALLGLRHPDDDWYPDAWDVVGGGVEHGEMPVACAVRELGEEVGVQLDPTALVHVDTVVGSNFELVVFAAGSWQGVPTNVADDEHAEIRWVDPVDVAALRLVDPRLADLVARAVDRVQRVSC